MAKVYVYTKEVRDADYPAGRAQSVHFASDCGNSESGEKLPWNRNYGILFASGTITDKNTICPKGVKNPKIFRTEDGKVNHSGRWSGKLLPRGRVGNGNWNELEYHVLIAENGIIRTYNREPLLEYQGYYDEPYPDMKWTLAQDTATISGYHCQKATCRFHGRNFEAWFTPEVPLSYGPWKFGGLPGLIVKVYDTDSYYTFECTNVEQVNVPMVRAKYSQRKPIKRETVLKFERKINENPYKTLGYKDANGNPMSRTFPYEPLELE